MSEERKPILNDYNLILGPDDTDSDGWHTYYEGSAMDKVRGFYENLIDTGVLIVAKEVELAFTEWDDPACGNCGNIVDPYGGDMFCAKCACKITTAPSKGG